MENRLFRQICGSDNCFLDLRHSFASDVLMGGVPLAIVGEMLGHRQVSTTKRYAHLASSVPTARARLFATVASSVWS